MNRDHIPMKLDLKYNPKQTSKLSKTALALSIGMGFLFLTLNYTDSDTASLIVGVLSGGLSFTLA